MSKIHDSDYLLNDQYRNAEKLNARIRLHTSFSVNRDNWFRWVFDHYDVPLDANVLELGCGPGDLWRENEHRIPVGWDITLSDFSPGMLAQARHNLSGHIHAFKFWQIDAQAIPLEDDCCQVVIANHCLYHIPDRAKALSEIYRVLKPDGWFYATTVGINHLREMDELVDGFIPGSQDVFNNAQNPFTLESGESQIKPWFSDIKVDRYLDALHVTEASPLVDYVFSTVRLGLDESQRQAFTAFIEAKITENGLIYITKDSGLLIARKK